MVAVFMSGTVSAWAIEGETLAAKADSQESLASLRKVQQPFGEAKLSAKRLKASPILVTDAGLTVNSQQKTVSWKQRYLVELPIGASVGGITTFGLTLGGPLLKLWEVSPPPLGGGEPYTVSPIRGIGDAIGDVSLLPIRAALDIIGGVVNAGLVGAIGGGVGAVMHSHLRDKIGPAKSAVVSGVTTGTLLGPVLTGIAAQSLRAAFSQKMFFTGVCGAIGGLIGVGAVELTRYATK